MKTSMDQRLRHTNEAEVAVPASATDASVSYHTAGIAEILNMRVGCWQAPIYSWAGPTAA